MRMNLNTTKKNARFTASEVIQILSAVPGNATVEMKWTSGHGYELDATWNAELPIKPMHVLVSGKGEND